MDEFETFSPFPAPTNTRPLLGLTILLVEDSRFASQAMRLMCLRSGARLRRADCLYAARRHLKGYRPSGVIVDIGLPDGSGLELIEELSTASPRVGMLLGLSGDPDVADRVVAAGADGCLIKPLRNLAGFQQKILAALPAERQLAGPRALTDEVIEPDRTAYCDDMSRAANLLNVPGDEGILDYVAQFLGGVARSAGDDQLADAARKLAHSRRNGTPSDLLAATARVGTLVQDRMQKRAAIY